MTNLNGNFLQFTFASAVDWLSFYSHRITTNDSALFHFIRFDWQLKRSGKLEWAQAFIFCNQFHDECQFLTLIQFETFQLIFFFNISNFDSTEFEFPEQFLVSGRWKPFPVHFHFQSIQCIIMGEWSNTANNRSSASTRGKVVLGTNINFNSYANELKSRRPSPVTSSWCSSSSSPPILT